MKVKWFITKKWDVVKDINQQGEPLLGLIQLTADQVVDVDSVQVSPNGETATIKFRNGDIIIGISTRYFQTMA